MVFGEVYWNGNINIKYLFYLKKLHRGNGLL